MTSLPTPKTGYRVVGNGYLRPGDLVWEERTSRWMRPDPRSIGDLVFKYVKVIRPQKKDKP